MSEVRKISWLGYKTGNHQHIDGIYSHEIDVITREETT